MFHLIWNRKSSSRKSSGEGDHFCRCWLSHGRLANHRPCHTALTVRDRGGLTPTQTDLFGGKSLNTSVEQRNERADGEVYKRKKEQFDRDLTRKLITRKLLIQFSFDMVNKRNGHVSLIVLLGIVSRGIATMDLATSHPRYWRYVPPSLHAYRHARISRPF